MDYRLLLRKYMRHIARLEGITFLKTVAYDDWDGSLTEEDLKELHKIEGELDETDDSSTGNDSGA